MNRYLNHTSSPVAIAVNFKAASASLTLAFLRRYDPARWSIITTPHGGGNGTAYPEGKGVFTTRYQAVIASPSHNNKTALLVVRDPCEKFRSACAEQGVIDIDAKLTQLENDPASVRAHFALQSRFLSAGTALKLYRFESDLEALAADADLAWPLPTVPTVENAPKPTLTAEQESRIAAIYAADIALHQSITEAGQIHVATLSEEQQREKTIQSTFDMAASAFNSLPKGKQLLWEPIRQGVVKAILDGDFSLAREILATTPDIYPDANQDRDQFLSLLPS